MAKSIAIFNQKGGVGKTTTNINLCTYLATWGKKVLTIDIDPQGNTTSGIGMDKKNINLSVYDVIIGGVSPDEAILHTPIKNLDIIPSTVQLAGAEIELTEVNQREVKLKEAIKSLDDRYDFIFIDCPPSLGLLTINALAAVDSVIIPIQCEFYALEGVGQLIRTIQLVKKGLNPALEIEGVILCMYDGRTNLSTAVVDEVKNFFKGKVYTTMIPRNIKLAESPSFGQPIMIYDPKCRGAEAYEDLAKEFIKNHMKNRKEVI
ncbi:sporulation initiation inhibitor protein Soj [Oxobacter pfennigii]|uniref:Sporulation initiation inhibitor protein Soj n=1 Tax=Oxobacter pfennigii TaxID=36849 RepID=A0A0P8W2Z7_9CLOT|nr:AAA family ATPase [Oxobacter pfennigii]KPU42946.1 sporulation initiation inhibitor protein Soj [Oxobacter pfennigii]